MLPICFEAESPLFSIANHIEFSLHGARLVAVPAGFLAVGNGEVRR
jgi:hypothetical protein